MKEIFKSCEPVVFTYVQYILRGHGIGFLAADFYSSSLFAGLDLVPQRILVKPEDHNDAARILREYQIKPSSDADGDRFRRNLRPW